MNHKKKITSGILSGALVISMVTPALADVDTSAVIEPEKKGTLIIHKLIENDGRTELANGLENPDENRVPVDNVGFDALKIADIQNVGGIIISNEAGEIDYDYDGGMVQVGAFYIPNDKFVEFCNANQVFPAPTYIKSTVVGDNTSLQYEYQDDIQKDEDEVFLKEKSDAVKAAKEALDNASVAKTTATNEYVKAQNEKQNAEAKETNARKALEAATKASQGANTALENANNASSSAASNLATAQTHLQELQTQLDNLTEALTDAAADNDDDATAFATAQTNFKQAQTELSAAEAKLAEAQNAEQRAKTQQAQALKAQQKATEILTQAQSDVANAKTGTPISATGAANALKNAQDQLAAANAALSNANEAYSEASTALEEAKSEMNNAKSSMQNAASALTDATGDKASSDAGRAALLKQVRNTSVDLANQTALVATLSDLASSRAAEASAAATKSSEAAAAVQQAQTALDNAHEDTVGKQATENAKESAKQTKETEYQNALNAYKAAVQELDTLANAEGIQKVYTAQSMQKALEELITTLSEEEISQWVAKNSFDGSQNNASTFGELSERYTDDHGKAIFPDMSLGLYLVAETDISYHDGLAGAYNDSSSGGVINNDQMNTYANGVYSITPKDAFSRDIKHDYQTGALYQESVNPEAPVLESLAAPFLVSLPTTNTIDSSSTDVSNNGQAGTVWQYTVDVYPKNQSTAIYKRIIDPDEEDGAETLRTSEDYQVGDVIEEVIWADAPKLQKNYLKLPTVAENTHKAFVIVNQMTEGLSYDTTSGIKKVMILPKSQLMTATAEKNQERTVFVNAEGTYISQSEAVDQYTNKNDIPERMVAANRVFVMKDGLLVRATSKAQGETVTKDDLVATGPYYVPKESLLFFDATGREISEATFETRTGKQIDTSVFNANGDLVDQDGNVIQFYTDINNEGKDVGTQFMYSGDTSEGFTGQYYITRTSSKFMTVPAASSTIPNTVSAFNIKDYQDADKMNGVELTDADYNVIDTLTNRVTITEADGRERVPVEEGQRGFAVVLTEAGLQKLNERDSDSVVVVFFETTLNKDAKIGEVEENMNYPQLFWANSNSRMKKVGGNEVYAYTYELQLEKHGVVDATNVKFVVKRTDENDINQVAATADVSGDSVVVADSNKNMTDMTAGVRHAGQDDSVWFVKEAEGVYHVFDSQIDNASQIETTSLTINGVNQTFRTLTPASNGKLTIKGLDSDKYTFKEIATETGKNLLADTFEVTLKAKDSAIDSVRDGILADATVSTAGSVPIGITIGLPGVTNGQDASDAIQTNRGIAGMTVTNNDVIDLSTGGKGRMMIYICGVALLGTMAVGLYATKKKEAKESE